MGTTAWIGYRKVSGVWMWLDGTPFDYDGFAVGEPSGTEECVIYGSDGMWFAAGCTTFQRVVCQHAGTTGMHVC